LILVEKDGHQAIDLENQDEMKEGESEEINAQIHENWDLI